MRIALLVGIAALLIGCGGVTYSHKVKTNDSGSFTKTSAIATAGTQAYATEQPAAGPVYMARESSRPSQHEMAVHRFHAQKRADAANNKYWSLHKIRVDRKQKEAQAMLESRKNALANQLDEQGPSMVLTDKRKRDAMRRLQAQREATMNALGDVVANTRWRLDLKPSRLNASRMPGNGLVGMQPHDRYISKEECPHQSCIDKARTSKAKLERLGNPLE